MDNGRYIVNFDADGVAFDFDQHVKDLTGKWPHEMTNDELWTEVAKHADFWLTMPLLDGFQEMLDLARPYGVRFITGCPSSDFDKAQYHKRQKIAKHFGADIAVVTCRAKDKGTYKQEDGDILVDDFIANVKRWTKAGGKAIYYKNAAQALAELKAALAEIDAKADEPADDDSSITAE